MFDNKIREAYPKDFLVTKSSKSKQNVSAFEQFVRGADMKGKLQLSMHFH